MSLEHCVGAGEPLNGEAIRQWRQMTEDITICDGYGQTETIMLCGNFAQIPVRLGSMGKPSPGVTLRILDESGAENACGEEGEIGVLCEKGEKVGFFGIFDGYMNTEGELRLPLRTGPDGRLWYLTGDRAKADADGYFWFVGRNDDVINSAGYRIGTHFPLLSSNRFMLR
jgi:medium-chain acyl-CoA synthetase